MLTAERKSQVISRFSGLVVAVLTFWCQSAVGVAQAQEASLWTYTGNDPGEQDAFHLRWVALNSDATHIATFAEQFGSATPKDAKYAVWDFATGRQLAAWRAQHWSVSMAMSNDAKLVVSLGHSAVHFDRARAKSLVVWQAADGKQLFEFEMPPTPEIKQLEKIRFSANNKNIYWLGSTTASLDRRAGKLVALGEKPSPPIDADYAPSSGRFVWLGEGVLEIYPSIENFARGREPQHRIDTPHPATEVRLSGDGSTVMVSLIPADGPDAEKQFLGAWDTASGKQLQLYNCQWAPFDYGHNFVVSHDGKFAAGTHGGRELLWIYDLQRNVATDFKDDAMGPVGFTPGGTLMARVPSSAIKFLDPSRLKVVPAPLTEAQRIGQGAAQPGELPLAKTDPKPAVATGRTWTSANGKFSVEATLVRVQGDAVVLRKQDGKLVTVPLAQLSAEDRQFVEDRQ